MDTRAEHLYRDTSAWELSVLCFKTIFHATTICLRGAICGYSEPSENTNEEKTLINRKNYNTVLNRFKQFPQTFDDVVLVHSPN